jgi:hypothetical protein
LALVSSDDWEADSAGGDERISESFEEDEQEFYTSV